MKKILRILSIILSFTIYYSNNVFAQTVYGPAIKFEYDAAGQRIKRYYNPNVALNKYGDTLTQTSPPDTIKRNHLLISDIVVKAYPNPTADFVIVENFSWKDGDKAEILLYDITGKFITKHVVNQHKESISFGGLAAGMYQLHYYLNNNLLTTWRIVRK